MMKLRVNEKTYYKHKYAFKKLYKSLGLSWEENTKMGDVWTNDDFSSYLRKIPEESGYKRFYAHNCQPMIDFLLGIGAEVISNEKFEDVIVKVSEPLQIENYKGHKNFQELLESVLNNWGVIWGNSLFSSNMSDDFKKSWRELDIKYKDYTGEDLYEEIQNKNMLRRKELGIPEDLDEDKEVIIKKKVDEDVLPAKVAKKKSKLIEVSPVKVESPLVRSEFKKKIFKITKK